ncbi:hypothetical protein VTP01DRAFT_7429 [Rhizomucor pusillus]|uniref:uncharacterized protein n=1 Tax=Rhizomucor pusillus TaxID=4840 RepID=UPI0037427409
MVWGGNDNAVQKWVKQLTENDPNLTSLHILSVRRLSEQDLVSIFAAIANNTVLQEFSCSGQKLTTKSCEQLCSTLKANSTLKKINVGSQELGQDTSLFGLICQGLAENQGLTHFDVENKALTDECIDILCRHLINNKTLQSLNLARNKLADNAAESLKRILGQEQHSLKELILFGNAIGPAGARALSSSLHLEYLDLSNNPLGEGAAELINPQATKLQVLKLNGVATEPHGNAIIQAMAERPSNLRHIELNENHIDSTPFKDLTDLGCVEELHLRDNKIDDEGIASLAEHLAQRSWERLELGDNAISHRGFGLLLNTSVKHIGLFNNKVNSFPDDLPSFLESGVVSLDLGCNQISVQDLNIMVDVILANGVPKLRVLEMGGNAKETETEQWSAAIERLTQGRPAINVAWRRYMEER